MTTETGTIRKATLVAEAARAMIAHPDTTPLERGVMAQVLALDNNRLAMLYNAIQYAREQA